MQRLKTRSQFQAVLTGGIVARTLHFSMYRTDLELSAATPQADLSAEQTQGVMYVGALVPKRMAKRSVTRNAIRRQIYSVSTDFKFALPVAAHVVRLRAGFDNKQFVSATSDRLKSAVRQELQQLFTSAAVRRSSAAQGA